jgi:hypothetical protein
MVKRVSRYDNSPNFQPDALGRSKFRGLKPRAVARTQGVLEYSVSGGDRLDLLGTRFFNDDRRWWRIADANAGFLFPFDMTLDASPLAKPDAIGRHGMSGVSILVPEKE